MVSINPHQILGDEHIELQRKEIIEVKRLLNEEVREKEAVQKTANELRNMVKKAEGEKTELARLLQDSRQKTAGTINAPPPPSRNKIVWNWSIGLIEG